MTLQERLRDIWRASDWNEATDWGMEAAAALDAKDERIRELEHSLSASGAISLIERVNVLKALLGEAVDYWAVLGPRPTEETYAEFKLWNERAREALK